MTEMVEGSYGDIILPVVLIVSIAPISYLIFRSVYKHNILSKSSLKDKKTVLRLLLVTLLLVLNVNLVISFAIVLFDDVSLDLYLRDFYSHTFNLKQSPIAETVANYEFKSVEFMTYSNLQDHFDIDVSFPQSVNHDKEALHEFYKIKCPKISFLDSFSLSASTKVTSLDSDNELLKIRNIALDMKEKNEYPILQYAFYDAEGESLEYILERKWFKFCTSPIWMDKHGVYIVISRVTYCPNQVYKEPKLSLLYGQVFDRDWNELDNYTINDSHNQPIVFPIIFPAHMDDFGDQSFLGPEDPRVILRDYFNEATQQMDQEPVIIFNTLVKSLDKARAMHVYRPFTQRTKTVRMDIHDNEIKKKEKNWSPFFSDDKNYIYYVYGLLPLRVLKCHIDNGVCFIVTGPDIDPEEEVQQLSGSTNLVEIPPNLLPKDLAQHRKLWFGFMRSHIHDCGCLEIVYRFHGILISTRLDEPNDVFTVDYVTSLMDFNINPESWNSELNDQKCYDGKSVLIPNSVAYWDFIPKNLSNSENRYGEDIMGIAYSEADINNKVIHIKGWLTHLSKVLDGSQHRFRAHYQRQSKNILESNFISECGVIEAAEYCAASERKFHWLNKPMLNSTELEIIAIEEQRKQDAIKAASERAAKIKAGELLPEDLEALQAQKQQEIETES